MYEDVKTEGEEECFNHWMRKMVKGSVFRKRLKVELPVYKKTLKFDSNEWTTLCLHPKFCILEHISLADMGLEKDVTKAKSDGMMLTFWSWVMTTWTRNWLNRYSREHQS